MAGCAKMSHFSGKCHWLKIVSPAEFKAPHKMMISIFAKNTGPFISYIKSVEHTLIEGHSKSYKCDDAPVILIRSSRQINFLKSSLSLSQQSLMISSIREAGCPSWGKRFKTCVMLNFKIIIMIIAGFCVSRDLASFSPQMTERWQG